MKRRTFQVLWALFCMMEVSFAYAAEKRGESCSSITAQESEDLDGAYEFSSSSDQRERRSVTGAEFQQLSLNAVAGLVMTLCQRVDDLEYHKKRGDCRISFLEHQCALLRGASEHALQRQRAIAAQSERKLEKMGKEVRSDVCKMTAYQDAMTKSVKDLSRVVTMQQRCSLCTTRVLEGMVGALATCSGSQEALEKEMGRLERCVRCEVPFATVFQETDSFLQGRSASVPCEGHFVPEPDEKACLQHRGSYNALCDEDLFELVPSVREGCTRSISHSSGAHQSQEGPFGLEKLPLLAGRRNALIPEEIFLRETSLDGSAACSESSDRSEK